MMGPSVTSETESEMKEYEEAPENLNEPRERLGLGLSLRDQEYLKHSSLFSRQQDSDDQPSSAGIPSTAQQYHSLDIPIFSKRVQLPPSSFPVGIIRKYFTGGGKGIEFCHLVNFTFPFSL